MSICNCFLYAACGVVPILFLQREVEELRAQLEQATAEVLTLKKENEILKLEVNVARVEAAVRFQTSSMRAVTDTCLTMMPSGNLHNMHGETSMWSTQGTLLLAFVLLLLGALRTWQLLMASASKSIGWPSRHSWNRTKWATFHFLPVAHLSLI